MIGKRLKLARVAAGLSLRALEDRIERAVTAQAIGKYERDEALPNSTILIALANALDVPVDYLVAGPALRLENIEFRKKASVRKREHAQVEAEILHSLERYLTVEELLNLPSAAWIEPAEAPYPVVSDVEEGERSANSLRFAWGLGLDPVPNFVEILEEQGIKVLLMKLENIAGFAARAAHRNNSAVRAIVVNSEDSGERQRFTMAHELGHIVMQVGSKVDEEKAANRFAGSFLMPAEKIWSHIGKRRTSLGWPELFDLKIVFGVSVQALLYRCSDLGIINQELFRRLCREVSRLGWRRPPYEPMPMKSAKTNRFERLCYRALAEGAIGEPKAAELLGISVHELNDRIDQPPN